MIWPGSVGIRWVILDLTITYVSSEVNMLQSAILLLIN